MTGQPWVSPSSLLLFLMAGAGCPAAHHLAPDLLHELWVLLLHLLCKLLAPADTQDTDRAAHSSGPPRAGRPPTLSLLSLLRPLAHPGVLSGSPFPATSTSKRSTHAWMRLARSLCCGLLPGVPRGLWPPEIMPDMLQERELSRPQPWPSTSMTHRQTALSRPHRHAPFFLRF